MASYNGTASRPGAWPDPDLVTSWSAVGADGATACPVDGAGKLEYCTGSFCDPVQNHAVAQFGLWAVMGAPLLLSFDLDNLDAKQKALYGNPEIVAVNQDRDPATGRGTAGGRRVFGGDFVAEVAEEEAACAFPHNRTGVEAVGLGHLWNVSSAEECAAKCCASDGCTTWQWDASYHPSNCPSGCPCWGGVEKELKSGGAWSGGSKHPAGHQNPPSPPHSGAAQNIWVRNLHDGGTAMIFVNNGVPAVKMACTGECVAAAGLSVGKKYAVRDLYAHKDLPPITLGAAGVRAGVDAGQVDGDAGSVLLKLSPMMETTTASGEGSMVAIDWVNVPAATTLAIPTYLDQVNRGQAGRGQAVLGQ